MNSTALISSNYLGTIQLFSILKNYETCWIDTHEHYIKQTHRSRCEIYSPNGTLTLSIPLKNRNHKQAMKEVKIAYEYNWQTLHWRSIESCYRRSPFFEFYEDDFFPFYNEKKIDYLIDFNETLQNLILSLLSIKAKYSFISEYHKILIGSDDFRNSGSTTNTSYNIKQYTQVFTTRHGFIPNLSVIDLLFNEGPSARDFL